MSELMVPCYESTTKRYRHEMAGNPEATSLPKPTDESLANWGSAAEAFDKMMGDIDEALRNAEGAHKGRAADAAQASIDEIKPHADHAAQACRGVQKGLEQQIGDQHQAFKALPSQGETLDNGREVQLDVPQKGWVEKAGLDGNPITGWMSDYEQRQEDFRATNDRAEAAMQRYKAQTDGNMGGLPQFQEDKAAPPPQPPPSDKGMKDANSAMAGSSMSTPGGASAPAASSSSWAAPSASAPSAPAPSAPTPGAPPAGSGSVWAPPAGAVRGPDGTMYRQNGAGGWERQNPYNGRWAPSPAGGPAGVGGAAAARGGAMGGASGGASGSGANQLASGGRAGTGSVANPGAGAAAGGAAAAGSGAGGRGAPMGGGAGAGARGGQGEQEEEHERPSWLVENEDVFTNDMQRVAPPVLGDTSGGNQ